MVALRARCERLKLLQKLGGGCHPCSISFFTLNAKNNSLVPHGPGSLLELEVCNDGLPDTKHRPA